MAQATNQGTHSAPQNGNLTDESGRNIIVMGGSAGAVEALMRITSALPSLDAAVFIVVHTARNGFSNLRSLLSRKTDNMTVVSAEDGLPIQSGHIYVAVPDYHLVVEKGFMKLVHGPTENRHRPAIDALFRSAAAAYGTRVIGVVLSGYLDDGSAGLHSIKRVGGMAVVQDPNDANVPEMPQNASASTEVDYIVTTDKLATLLQRLVREPIGGGEIRAVRRNGNQKQELVDPKGTPSAYTCPECHGTLWEVQDGKLLRYACRVGHAFSAESMLQDQCESAERAMWAALRALEERADISKRMAERSRNNGHVGLAERYELSAHSATCDAQIMRKLLLENKPPQARERHDDLAESA